MMVSTNSEHVVGPMWVLMGGMMGNGGLEDRLGSKKSCVSELHTLG